MSSRSIAYALVVALSLAACGSGKDDTSKDGGPSSDTDTDTPTDTDTDTDTVQATGETATATGDTSDTNPGTGNGVLEFVGAPPKNLLFLSIDTYRKDHFGAYGDLGLTPFLDTLSSTGVVLENHVQCSDWTFGSTTCTLAGRTNVERGHMPRLNGQPHQRTPVPAGTPFLASWLGEAGFYNVLTCGNSWLSAQWGNTQGYHEEVRVGGGALGVGREGISALQDAIARGDVDEQWFLHLHFMEPHAPYTAPDEYNVGLDALEPWPENLKVRDNQYQARDLWGLMTPEQQELLEAHLRLMYAGEIRLLDARLEMLWGELEAAGLLDDTLVVLWNDHGEQFWEHDEQTHAYRLHREETDGIAMFWSKNIVPGRHEGYTSSVDLVPTLLDLWGIPKPPEVTGFAVGTAPVGRPIFSDALARRGGQQSVVVDGLKLHYSWSGTVQLFDRTSDPGELVDLYDPEDPRVLDLWNHLKPMVDAMAPLSIDGPYPVYPPDLP